MLKERNPTRYRTEAEMSRWLRLPRAGEAVVSWPLPDDMDDAGLEVAADRSSDGQSASGRRT